MAKRVSIQDIADALGLSRNTVSKVINNNSGVAEETRERILRKAVDMGYSQFTYLSDLSGLIEGPDAEKPEPTEKAEQGGADSGGTGTETEYGEAGEPAEPDSPVKSGKEIVVLLAKPLNYSHFASHVLDLFRQEIDRFGYSMRICQIQPTHLTALTLPPAFRREQAAAVVCIEVFERQYAEMVPPSLWTVRRFSATALCLRTSFTWKIPVKSPGWPEI